MVEVYVKSIRGAPSLDETARCVCEAVGSDELFAFGELLAEPKVTALRDSPQHAKFYRLLQLFAYGMFVPFDLVKHISGSLAASLCCLCVCVCLSGRINLTSTETRITDLANSLQT